MYVQLSHLKECHVFTRLWCHTKKKNLKHRKLFRKALTCSLINYHEHVSYRSIFYFQSCQTKRLFASNTVYRYCVD